MKKWIDKLFKNWYKSKTQIFNASLVAVGIIQANPEEFRSLIPIQAFGLFIVAIGLIGWLLRIATTKPLEDK